MATIEDTQPIPTDTFDACQVLKDVYSFLDRIINSPNPNYFSAHDSCVLEMLDSFTVKFITTGSDRYLDVFNAFRRRSDGYVSTALDEIAGPQLLQERPEEIGRYLYSHRGEVGSLEEMITWAAAIDIAFADDKQKEARRENYHTLITRRCSPREEGKGAQAYFDELWTHVEERIHEYEE
jgi:hypothetical protein